MTQFAIETSRLRKVYGSKVAVEELTLNVPQGEIFGFLGPNGAGKSTTIKMLLGLVKPSGGRAQLFGRPVQDSQVRRQIGFLPEHFRFHEWLRAAEFLEFHGRLYGLSSQTLARRIPELLALVGLGQNSQVRLNQFSKGMLQRVGLAQAMLHRPRLIFLDEPTSGLDPLGRRLVRDVIYRLKADGTTVFLNSHLLSEVEVTCDRVAFIKHGRVIQTEAVADLLRQTTAVYLRVDRLSPDLLAALAQIGRQLQPQGKIVTLVVDSEQRVPELVQAVLAHGARLYELRPKQTSLEEIFVKIIGSDEGDGQ